MFHSLTLFLLYFCSWFGTMKCEMEYCKASSMELTYTSTFLVDLVFLLWKKRYSNIAFFIFYYILAYILSNTEYDQFHLVLTTYFS